MGMVDSVGRYEGVRPQAVGLARILYLYTSAEPQNGLEIYWGGSANYSNNFFNKITLNLFDKDLIQFTIN